MAYKSIRSPMKFNNRGDELRSLIAIARKDLKRWESELQIYCHSIIPIQKIPPETLSQIFKLYLADNPRLIRRLLLVSRRWYQVATLDPSLWTHLSIEIDSSETELDKFVEEAMPYTVACLQHSQSMLLHIKLDLSFLESLSTPEHRRLTLKSTTSLGLDFNSLSFASSVALPVCAPPSSPSFENGSHIEDLIYILVGCDSQNLRRWRSLDLGLPKDQSLTHSIWTILRGSAPNLRHLSIQGSSHVSFFNPFHNSIVSDGLKDLHQLRSLRLRNIDDFSKLPVSNDILSTLDIETAMDVTSITKMQGFKNLRSLRIYAPLLGPDALVHATAPLSLPILEEVRFCGHHNRLGAISFDFPALQRVYICDPAGRIFDSLPELMPPHIHFSIPITLGERNSDGNARAVITRIARRYPSAKSLTIHAYDVKKQEEHLLCLKESGVLPLSLTTRVHIWSGGEWYRQGATRLSVLLQYIKFQNELSRNNLLCVVAYAPPFLDKHSSCIYVPPPLVLVSRSERTVEAKLLK